MLGATAQSVHRTFVDGYAWWALGGAPALAHVVARGIVVGRVLLYVHLPRFLTANVANEHETDRLEVA